MKLRYKINLLIVLILTIAMVVPTLFVVLAIRQEALDDAAKIRVEEEDKLRSSLENLVEAVWTNVGGSYSEFTTRTYQEKNYGVTARALIDSLSILMQNRYQRVKAGRLTMDEARAWTLEELRQMRFGGEEGYVWVQDLGTPTPKVIMHPTLTEFEGQTPDEPRLQTAENRGENVFVAAAKIASQSREGGYLDYLITRVLPDGKRLDRVPKLSFVRYLPEWGWAIGTGISLDRIIEEGTDWILNDVGNMHFQHGAGSFWVCNRSGKLLSSTISSQSTGSLATDSSAPFIAKALEGIREKDTTFFDLQITNPLNGRADRHLFHARLFEPLDWVIGTSMNASFIDRQVQWAIEDGEKKIWHLCLSLFAFTIVLLILSMWLITRVLQEYGVQGLDEAIAPPSISVVPQAVTPVATVSQPQGKPKKNTPKQNAS